MAKKTKGRYLEEGRTERGRRGETLAPSSGETAAGVEDPRVSVGRHYLGSGNEMIAWVSGFGHRPNPSVMSELDRSATAATRPYTPMH